MIILVDGYNFLHAINQERRQQLPKRDFMLMLNAYARAKRHGLYIFFDGFDETRFEGRHVQIHYAGSRREADADIIAFVDAHEHHELVLVSFDRALCQRVMQKDVVCVDPDVFYPKVQHALRHESSFDKSHKSDRAIKTDALGEGSSLDELMRIGSQRILFKKDDEVVEAVEPVSGKMRSAKTKRLDNILKKL